MLGRELFTSVDVENVTESLFKLFVSQEKCGWACWARVREVYPYVALHMCTERWCMAGFASTFYFSLSLLTQFTLHACLSTSSIQFTCSTDDTQNNIAKCFLQRNDALHPRRLKLQCNMTRDEDIFPFINVLQLVALSTHKSIAYMATPIDQSQPSTR